VKVKGKNGQGVFWRVGIDRPKDHNMERELSAIVSLENQSMVTSGNYRNFYEIDGKRYSHSLNPTTGYPAENTLLSVTVITEGCAEADAFATAFMVMGLEKTKAFLNDHPEIIACLIYSEGEQYGMFYSPILETKLKEL